MTTSTCPNCGRHAGETHTCLSQRPVPTALEAQLIPLLTRIATALDQITAILAERPIR